MHYLLVVAHGSRRQQSNDELQRLVAVITARPENVFDGIRHAFLELAQPSIADAIDNCVQQGAKMITVMPYFLANGNHVSRDVPAIIEAKRRDYPDVPIQIKPYLGQSDKIGELILEIAQS